MILVTGGAGYIGSHTVLTLCEAGHQVLIVDNLSNSSSKVLDRLKKLVGAKIPFVEGDIRDTTLLYQLFSQYKITAVIHFAGLKAVGESVAKPLLYYDNNVSGSLKLLTAMQEAQVKTIIFSSSATVYGAPLKMPITEDMPVGNTTNPYGRSKYMIENMLQDLYHSDPQWRVVLLRYFNPIAAHKSGKIGEDPRGIPNNLLPFVSQVAVGKQEKLLVFGDDYPTPDGTGVRDYIHVMDLAYGHLKAFDKHANDPGVHVYNLGTGQGYSVLEVIKAFAKASGQRISYQIVPRRPGDIAICYADPSKALRHLGWRCQYSLPQMMEDTWRWQSHNPNGYESL